MTDPVMSSLLRINRQRLYFLQRTILNSHGYVGAMHLIQDGIANFFCLDKTSVARGARRLEEMGHLRRAQDPENRRQYQLFLTPEGEEMLEKIEHAYDRFQEKLADGISVEDWTLLSSLLRRLEDNSCREPDSGEIKR